MSKISKLVIALSAVLLFQAGSARAEAVSQAKAAELALHRVERLVILKKIEEGFQNRIQGVTVEPLSHQAPDQPSFRTVASQWPAADGSQKKVEIILNEEGKSLSYTVLSGGGDSAGNPTWPDKDPTTLSENSLHYVLEGSVTDAKLVPYNTGLIKFTTSQEAGANGTAVAVVDMEATGASQKLRVRINADGTFNSAEYLPLN